jgi:hypothetical protein
MELVARAILQFVRMPQFSDKLSISGRTSLLFLILKLYALRPPSPVMMRLFENRVLMRIFGPKRDEVSGEWRSYIMKSLMICTPHQMLFE